MGCIISIDARVCLHPRCCCPAQDNIAAARCPPRSTHSTTAPPYGSALLRCNASSTKTKGSITAHDLRCGLKLASGLFSSVLPRLTPECPKPSPQLLSKHSSQTGTKKHSLTRFGCASGGEWPGFCLGAYHPGIRGRGMCMLRAISSRLVRVRVGEIDHSRNSGKGRDCPPTRPSRSSGQPQRRLQGSPLPSALPLMLRALVTPG